MSTTNIEWADKSWNPVTGCSPVSPGCDHCYARRLAEGRLRGRYGYPKKDPFQVTLQPLKLRDPLHWKKPRRVFVCSMGDLFHPDVSHGYRCLVFETMHQAPQHTYMLLTKRPENMLRSLDHYCGLDNLRGIFPNVWCGVSAENQKTLEERWTMLRVIPAAVRFVSLEPLLGPVSIPHINKLGWVIVGGETGAGARPMNPDWVREVRDDCNRANVPFFFKHWGAWQFNPLIPGTAWQDRFERIGKKKAGRLLDGREWNEFPAPAR